MELVLYLSLVLYLTNSFNKFSNYFYISGKLKLNTEITITFVFVSIKHT